MTRRQEDFDGTPGDLFNILNTVLDSGFGLYTATPSRNGTTSGIARDDDVTVLTMNGGGDTPNSSGLVWFWLRSPSQGVSTSVGMANLEVAGAYSTVFSVTVTAGGGTGSIVLAVQGLTVASFDGEGWYVLQWNHRATAGELDLSLDGPGGTIYADTDRPVAVLDAGLPIIQFALYRDDAGPFNAVDQMIFDDALTPVPVVVASRCVRQWPRDDAYGMGSGSRVWPPPRSGRAPQAWHDLWPGQVDPGTAD